MQVSTDPPLGVGEEIANSITHGLGALLSIAALVVLLVYSVRYGTAWHVVSCSIYGTTLILSYLSSTLYHALTPPRAKHVFRIIDHSAIFLLIAGSYTPFILISLRNPAGISLLALVWSAAIAGIVFKSVSRGADGFASGAIYVALGWAALLIVRPLVGVLPGAAMAWIVAGGLSYTIGVAFFSMRWRYAHTIWHLFVLAGSVSHFVAIHRYLVLPR